MNNQDSDLESVRQEYRAQLQELTFNSKPIITTLTIIAQENIHVARGIVQAIEDQIKTSPPPQKLPVIYLLDSISKNVGGVYIQIFSHNLLQTFLDAYIAVDDTTKQKFERLLATWKVGPNGGPVYPPDVTAPIERALLKQQQQQMRYQHRGSIDGGRSHIHINPNFLAGMQNQNTMATYQHQSPQNQPVTSQSQSQNQWPEGSHYSNGSPSYTTPPSRQGYYSTQPYSSEAPVTTQLPLQQSSPVFVPPPDQARLVQECRALLLQRQQLTLQNAGDPNNQNHILALQQLLDVIQVTLLTPDQIQQFRQQIAASMSPSPAAATTQANLGTTIAATPFPIPTGIGNSLPLSTGADLTSIMIPHSTVLNAPQSNQPFLPSTPTIPHPIPPVSSVRPPIGTPVADPNALVQNLMDLGLLGSSGTGLVVPSLKGINFTGSAPGTSLSTIPSVVNQIGKIELTSGDIQRRRDGAISILYDAFPLQCKQCGFRYAKDDEGKAKMDAHLDWHFRQNRRMKDKAKKAQSRTWFVSEEDWIHSRESEFNNSQSPAFFDFDSFNKNVVNTAQPKKEEVNESKVIVPLDWDKISKPCPICQEKFKSDYSDADDEWIFKNAVEIEGAIYHASCYADVVKVCGHKECVESLIADETIVVFLNEVHPLILTD